MNENSVNCPRCGNYVGAADYCEICHQKIERELSSVRKFFLIISVIGVALLVVIASELSYSYMKIGKISPTNNYGVVRIAGRVISIPFITENSLVFTIEDDSGSVDIRIYYPVFMHLKCIPEYGDYVRLVGKINYRANYYYLLVDSPNHIEIERLPTLNTTVNSLISGNFDKIRVRVQGKLHHLSKKVSWYGKLYNDSYISLYFPSYLIRLKGYSEFSVGDNITVEGVVKWYGGVGGEWEIIVSEVKKL